MGDSAPIEIPATLNYILGTLGVWEKQADGRWVRIVEPTQSQIDAAARLTWHTTGVWQLVSPVSPVSPGSQDSPRPQEEK